MTEQEALEITAAIQAVTPFTGVASRSEVRKPLLALADTALESVEEGTTRNDLQIAVANLASLGKD